MDDFFYYVCLFEDEVMTSNYKQDLLRNGSVSDSRLEGCVVDSGRVHFYMQKSCVVIGIAATFL